MEPPSCWRVTAGDAIVALGRGISEEGSGIPGHQARLVQAWRVGWGRVSIVLVDCGSGEVSLEGMLVMR